MTPPMLGSPPFPAPTTRQRLPSSFTNIGNKLLIIFVTLPRRSAHVPQANHGQLLLQILPPGSSAALCQCDEQRIAASSPLTCRRPGSDAADVRWALEPRSRRSGIP